MRVTIGRHPRMAVTGLSLLAALALFAIACGSSAEQTQPADRSADSCHRDRRARRTRFLALVPGVELADYFAAAYDPYVLKTLVSGEVMSAVSLAGGSLQKAEVRKVDAVPSTLGTLVTLTVRNDGKDETVSFLVRRRNSEWRILYDSLLADILPTYVQSEIAAQARPGRSPPGDGEAGTEAARIYRQISSQLRTGDACSNGWSGRSWGQRRSPSHPEPGKPRTQPAIDRRPGASR